MFDNAVAEGKIHQALTRLGVSFMDAINIVRYDSDAGTAYWSYDEDSVRESICVGPIIAAMDISSIEMVLRHEFLHRATYHGFHERFKDHQLLNIVEDVCINRLLYEAYPEKIEKLSIQVYSAEAKKTIIALADCSAKPEGLTANLALLWHYIWDKDTRDNFSVLNPSSLYYRLLEVKKEIDWELVITIVLTLPFASSDSEEDTSSFPDGMSGSLQTVLDAVLKDLGGRLPCNSDSGAMMNTFLNTRFQFNGNIIKDFIRNLEVDKIVCNSKEALLETIRRVSTDVYPLNPSRLGLIWMNIGISKLLGMYSNIRVEEKPVRLKLCFYVDISGSMASYFGLVHGFIQSVYDVPLSVRLFDTAVKEISVDNYCAGRFRVGGGTDFDVVIADLLADSTVGAGLLFTDGESTISPENQTKLKASGKRIFVVYFVPQGQERPKSVLNDLAERILVMPVKK